MINKFEELSLFKLMKDWQQGAEPALTTTNSQDLSKFNPDLFDDDIDRRIRFSTDERKSPAAALYKSLLKRMNKELVRIPTEFHASVTTIDITRSYEDDKQGIVKAFKIGEIDEPTYFRLLQSIETQEYPEHDEFNTMWQIFFRLARESKPEEKPHTLTTLMPYRFLYDENNTTLIQEARISFEMLAINARFFQQLIDDLIKSSNPVVRVEFPYSWESVNQKRGGAGKIRIEYLLTQGSIQIFFDKAPMGGYPLVTGAYSINTNKDVPQELLPDQPSALFGRSFFPEGEGKLLPFEHIEDFLDELISTVSDYTVGALKLAFALMLIQGNETS